MTDHDPGDEDDGEFSAWRTALLKLAEALLISIGQDISVTELRKRFNLPPAP